MSALMIHHELNNILDPITLLYPRSAHRACVVVHLEVRSASITGGADDPQVPARSFASAARRGYT